MAHASGTRAAVSRAPAPWALAPVLACGLALIGCGGSTGGSDNDGTLVTRTGIAVTGIADDGTATSPIAGGTCRAVGADGRTLSTDTTGDDGSFLLLVNPGVEAFISCAAAGQDNLAIRRFISTVGLAEGADLPGQDVLPSTTVIGRIVAQEAADDPGLDAGARFMSLQASVVPLGSELTPADADLQLLADAATVTYDLLREAGTDVEFEPVLADIYDDGTLDLVLDTSMEGPAATAAAVDAAIAELEATAGRSVEDAVLATHPAFTLSVLNVGAGRSQLDEAARFVTLVRATRETAREFGGVLTLTAGDSTAAVRDLVISTEDANDFFDALLLDALDLDVLAIGPTDLALGPNLPLALVDALETDPVTLLSDVDFINEPGFVQLSNDGRLQRSILVEERARRIAFLSAADPELAARASLRRLTPLTGEAQVERIQAGVDAARASGARIVVLLAGIESLTAVEALLAQLEGIDVVASLPPGAGQDGLVSGDELSGAGVFPVTLPTTVDAVGASIPVIQAVGDNEGLTRLEARFDPLGRVIDGTVLGEARLVAPGDAEVPTVPDPDIQRDLEEPLQAAVEAFESTRAAQTEVELDTRAEALLAGDSNWGNLVAEAVLRTARANASTFTSIAPLASLVDSGSMATANPIAVGTITRGEVFDRLADDEVVGVLQAVTPADLKRLLEFSFANRETGRFAQLAGLAVQFDPEGAPQVLGEDGTVTTAGARVVEVRLGNSEGELLIEGGTPLEAGRTIPVAVSEGIARSYPLGELELVNVGVTVEQAVDSFLRVALNEEVQAEDFPAGGGDRLTPVAAGG